MPRGVPVATVGINNAANAALLAARILALQDDSIAKALASYIKKMEEKIVNLDINK
jgi:phosphoribosylcarboxyaminoimidazole (NCAIR) mutase